MIREEHPAPGKDIESVIQHGAFFKDSYGQRFIFVSNKGEVYYAHLKNADERVILGKVRSYPF